MKRILALLAICFMPVLTSAQATKDVTANDVIERIKKNVGVEWRAETVDTFKAGDPGTKVTGIASPTAKTKVQPALGAVHRSR